MVTQCPIIPGGSYEYDFQVPNQVSFYLKLKISNISHTYMKAGTFWYHSHVATQYCDGLRGPLVVYDPNDPHAHLYDIDDGLSDLLLEIGGF